MKISCVIIHHNLFNRSARFAWNYLPNLHLERFHFRQRRPWWWWWWWRWWMWPWWNLKNKAGKAAWSDIHTACYGHRRLYTSTTFPRILVVTRQTRFSHCNGCSLYFCFVKFLFLFYLELLSSEIKSCHRI